VKYKKQLLEEKINRINDIIESLEKKDIVKYYLQWRVFGESERNRLKHEWDEYYRECEQTKEARAYQQCRDHLKTGNIASLKDLANRCAERWQTDTYSKIKEPRLCDPMNFSFNYDINQYKHYEGVLSRLDSGQE
jgi:hypothetical protein